MIFLKHSIHPACYRITSELSNLMSGIQFHFQRWASMHMSWVALCLPIILISSKILSISALNFILRILVQISQRELGISYTGIVNLAYYHWLALLAGKEEWNSSASWTQQAPGSFRDQEAQATFFFKDTTFSLFRLCLNDKIQYSFLKTLVLILKCISTYICMCVHAYMYVFI